VVRDTQCRRRGAAREEARKAADLILSFTPREGKFPCDVLKMWWSTKLRSRLFYGPRHGRSVTRSIWMRGGRKFMRFMQMCEAAGTDNSPFAALSLAAILAASALEVTSPEAHHSQRL